MQNGTYHMHVPFVWKGEASPVKGAVCKRSKVSGAAKLAGVFPS